MENSIVKTKSFAFAKRIIKMYMFLVKEKKVYTLSKQVLRSGTSVGANVYEAHAAISKRDFLSKMSIALKEITETIYWLDLFQDTDILSQKEYEAIVCDAIELQKILVAIVKNTRKNIDIPVNRVSNTQHNTRNEESY